MFLESTILFFETMLFLIPAVPVVLSFMSTSALAFSNKSIPTKTSTSSTLTNKQAHVQAQHEEKPSSLSTRAGGQRMGRRSSKLGFSPADIGGAATLLSLKVDGASATIGAKLPQVLSDASYVAMDPNKFFPDIKISKLRMRYAQVFGRLMILGTSFLPHHGVHPEELAVQLFLLSVSMKPIIRSVKLYNCISSNKGDCAEECALEFEELEAALAINTAMPAAMAV